MIMINGSLKESQWADKNTGQKRTKLSVKMYNFAFVEPYDPNRVDSGGGGSGWRWSRPLQRTGDQRVRGTATRVRGTTTRRPCG